MRKKQTGSLRQITGTELGARRVGACSSATLLHPARGVANDNTDDGLAKEKEAPPSSLQGPDRLPKAKIKGNERLIDRNVHEINSATGKYSSC